MWLCEHAGQNHVVETGTASVCFLATAREQAAGGWLADGVGVATAEGELTRSALRGRGAIEAWSSERGGREDDVEFLGVVRKQQPVDRTKRGGQRRHGSLLACPRAAPTARVTHTHTRDTGNWVYWVFLPGIAPWPAAQCSPTWHASYIHPWVVGASCFQTFPHSSARFARLSRIASIRPA